MVLRWHIEERFEALPLLGYQLPSAIRDSPAACRPCLQSSADLLLRTPAFQHAELRTQALR
jgi:hypothetical protein